MNINKENAHSQAVNIVGSGIESERDLEFCKEFRSQKTDTLLPVRSDQNVSHRIERSFISLNMNQLIKCAFSLMNQRNKIN